MSFTSISFLLFFAVFMVLYALCPERFRQYLLLLGSLFFCIWGSWLSALIALGFAVFNYLIAWFMQGMSGTTGRRIMMIAGVSVNAAALMIFKIFAFLPLGISFYTFACIAYLIDVYRRTIKAESNPATFAAYVTMFPKFQMGPITRYSDVQSRFAEPKVKLKAIQSGLELFALGFCVKILLADKLAYLWNEMTTIGYDSLSTPLAWLGILSFSLQLYLEWQGYTWMALGVGRMLGFELPQNFNYPYLAKSIGDFYRRWHMTLTRWFKDYIYIPLGGNRKGTGRTILNILLIWLITSVWHGIGWNFLFWGLSIGLLIVLEKFVIGKWLDKLHVLPHLYVLFFIMLTWCCFKITDIGDLGTYFSRLFPLFSSAGNVNSGDFLRILLRYLPYLLFGIFFCFPIPEGIVKRYGKSWIVSLILAALFWWAVHTMIQQGSNTMMYLNF